jgi:hypothetical protein
MVGIVTVDAGVAMVVAVIGIAAASAVPAAKIAARIAMRIGVLSVVAIGRRAMTAIGTTRATARADAMRAVSRALAIRAIATQPIGIRVGVIGISLLIRPPQAALPQVPRP